MKAAVTLRYGPPEVVRIEDRRVHEPRKGELLSASAPPPSPPATPASGRSMSRGGSGLTSAAEALGVAQAAYGDTLDVAARFFVEEIFS